MPSSSVTCGSQPSTFRHRVLSELRPRTPCGPSTCRMPSFLPLALTAILASWSIVTSRSDPMFSGPE